jgi:Spy/CpxP family protein refolding chaperone
MMNRKGLIGISALVALVAVAAGAAFAAGHGGRGKMMKAMISAHVEEMEDAIEATPQQRQVIEAAKDDVLQLLQSKQAAHQQTHGQVLGLLGADRLDVDALNAIADQKAQDVREIGHAIVADIAKVHAVLTPAQRAKLLEKMKEHHGHWKGGFGGQ